MTYLSKLRRHAVAALSIAAILTVVPATISNASIPEGRHEAAKICDYDWQNEERGRSSS